MKLICLQLMFDMYEDNEIYLKPNKYTKALIKKGLVENNEWCHRLTIKGQEYIQKLESELRK